MEKSCIVKIHKISFLKNERGGEKWIFEKWMIFNFFWTHLDLRECKIEM